MGNKPNTERLKILKIDGTKNFKDKKVYQTQKEQKPFMEATKGTSRYQIRELSKALHNLWDESGFMKFCEETVKKLNKFCEKKY